MSEQPFEIDDEHSIKIYGVDYSMGFFKALAVAPIGTVLKIIRRENGMVTVQQLTFPT